MNSIYMYASSTVTVHLKNNIRKIFVQNTSQRQYEHIPIFNIMSELPFATTHEIVVPFSSTCMNASWKGLRPKQLLAYSFNYMQVEKNANVLWAATTRDILSAYTVEPRV